jgi:hypothetical protein
MPKRTSVRSFRLSSSSKSVRRQTVRGRFSSGVGAPGFSGLPATGDRRRLEDDGQRFQNYRAVLTVLDVPVIPSLD